MCGYVYVFIRVCVFACVCVCREISESNGSGGGVGGGTDGGGGGTEGGGGGYPGYRVCAGACTRAYMNPTLLCVRRGVSLTHCTYSHTRVSERSNAMATPRRGRL